MGGDLPCSKEEAATLAGIQLRIEESWGRPLSGGTSSTTQHHPAVPVSPDDPSTLRPISEDKVSPDVSYNLVNSVHEEVTEIHPLGQEST